MDLGFGVLSRQTPLAEMAMKHSRGSDKRAEVGWIFGRCLFRHPFDRKPARRGGRDGQSASRVPAGGAALFAYHLAGHRSDKATLQWLADASGGAVFDVAEEAELDRVAVAHRSRPWQIVKVTARGADEILIQGASKTVYPSQPLVIAGRGALKGPLRIVLKRGKEKQTLEFEPRLEIASPAAARLYGQLAVERLEPYAENLAEVTIAFARFFRVPGRTCSMVMLETAEDYQRFGVNVPPEEDHLVIASTSVAGVIEEQDLELQAQRQNPRKRFLVWVDLLESASLLNVSTALRLAMKRLPDSAFRFDAEPLVCRSWKTVATVADKMVRRRNGSGSHHALEH